MTEQVEVTLNDTEWRVRCEELAKAELTLQEQKEAFESDASDWADQKKEHKTKIQASEAKIRVLAREVDTRKAYVDAQQTLPGTEPEALPGPDDDDEAA